MTLKLIGSKISLINPTWHTSIITITSMLEAGWKMLLLQPPYTPEVVVLDKPHNRSMQRQLTVWDTKIRKWSTFVSQTRPSSVHGVCSHILGRVTLSLSANLTSPECIPTSLMWKANFKHWLMRQSKYEECLILLRKSSPICATNKAINLRSLTNQWWKHLKLRRRNSLT